MHKGDAVRYGIGIAVLLAAGVLALVLSRATEPAVHAAPSSGKKFSALLLDPLTVGQAGEIVAAGAGLFDRAGISMELKPADTDPIEAVVDGKVAFGVVEADSFLKAYAKGAPIVSFGGAHLESEIVFFSREFDRIYSPREFPGKRVVRLGGSSSALVYDAVLRNTGISRSAVREMASGDIEDLAEGKVDVLPGRVTADSYLLKRRNLPFAVMRPGDYGVHIPGLVYFTTRKLLSDNPSVVLAFLKGVIAGWQAVYADVEKSVPLLVAAGGGKLDSDEVKFKLAIQREFVLPIGRRAVEFDDQQWRQLATLLRNARLIDGTTNMSEAVNYDLLKEAYRTPVTSTLIRGN